MASTARPDRCRLTPSSGQDMAHMRNGDMDRIGGLVDKPVQFSGGLVAEHGARPR